jgi:DnaJ domain
VIWRRPRDGSTASSQPPDPFRVLGLTPDPELSDDDVRAAWRRVAAATHPDRADGGDPDGFAAAAAAYTALLTPAARRDALAFMAAGRRARPARALTRLRLPGLPGSAVARIWGGRPGRIALRAAAAALAVVVAVFAVGWQPASIGVAAGALTWLALTGRQDLAPQARVRPPRRGPD